MTINIENVMAEAIQENRTEKLVLIDDIVRAKKFLFGQGQKQHNEFLFKDKAGKLFDELYELSIDELVKQLNNHTETINQLIRKEILP